MEKFKLKFLGAAGTVTGSKILLEFMDQRYLIDCGLFQGLKVWRRLNWQDIGVDPASISAVILTHAHLDHCGYLPLLVKNGFEGKIHCTQPTIDLANLILVDSGKIQEEDAARANQFGYSQHTPALPLYNQKDALKVNDHFLAHDYEEWVVLGSNIKFVLHNAGHIVGSAMIEIKIGEKTLLLSGDLGRKDPLLLYPAIKDISPNYLVIESTYGGRIHKAVNPKTALFEQVADTLSKKGTVLIPAFAVERTQEIIYLLYELIQEGKLSNIPIYLDSPMAASASKIYQSFDALIDLKREVRKEMFNVVQIVRDFKASQYLVENSQPKIIIAGSGMLEGGRILNYLKQHLIKSNSKVIFCGYQAEGTRGRDLLKGKKEIKIHGEWYPVLCQIAEIEGMSAHADQKELLSWMSNFNSSLERIFLNHGELEQMNEFALKIKSRFGIHPTIPLINESFKLP